MEEITFKPVTRKNRPYIICRMYTDDDHGDPIFVGYSIFNSNNIFIEYSPTLKKAQLRCDALNRSEEALDDHLRDLRETKKDDARDDDYLAPYPTPYNQYE